ncbi:UNVERIFIED_CONTAM: hypothetical protein Slati_0503400 [Sesamum latifolium]|uniref:Uncharacterized protein n=1 Tax=Sesamum latifolium TaxID=2727402 RepID=A0AAW2XZZ3_9LAMI
MVIVTSGLKNIDIYYTEPTQSHIHVSKNFTLHEDDAEDPIADTFAKFLDVAFEPDEVECPIPPKDGPNDVDINVMAKTFAQDMWCRWEL